jgi:rhodanese-related sulfurtransferase
MARSCAEERSVKAILLGSVLILGLCAPCTAADITASELRARAPASVYVLDVRTPGEFAEGHVPGAVNIPVDELDERLAEVPKGSPVVVYCESGKRAKRAEKLLATIGRDVRHLEGDMRGWRKAELDVER